MGWLAIAGVYASVLLAGAVVVRALWGEEVSRLGFAARVLLIGPAAIAVEMIVLGLLAIPWSLGLILIPWWVVAAWWLVRRRAEVRRERVDAGRVEAGPARSRWVTWVLMPTSLGVFASIVWFGLRTPVLDSDPMNNFALPARIFETHRGLAGETLAELRTVGHIEYPPLVALNEALVFMAAAWGEVDRSRAAAPFFALAWLALQWLVIALAGARLHPALGVGIALLVMLTPEPYTLGTVGLADLRLAASVLLLGIEGGALLRRPAPRAAFRYAAVGLACALTKNEGVIVAGAALVPVLALTVGRRLRPAAGVATIALVLAGALVWSAYLLAHGVKTGNWDADAIGGLSSGVGDRMLRALSSFRGFGLGAAGSNSFYGVLWSAGLAMALVGLVRAASRRETSALLVALLAHLGLYAGVIAVMPQPIEWTLRASGLRMFSHLLAWPILLMLAAAARRPRLAAADRDCW